MRRATVEELLESFKRNHPGFCEKIVSYYQDGPMGLVVKLNNGKVIWYDDINKSLRRLPDNADKMSPEDFLYEFKKRVEKMLIFKGMSQNDLAEKAEIHPVQLSKYLNGRNIPSFFVADKIARALDCLIDELRYSGRKEN